MNGNRQHPHQQQQQQQHQCPYGVQDCSTRLAQVETILKVAKVVLIAVLAESMAVLGWVGASILWAGKVDAKVTFCLEMVGDHGKRINALEVRAGGGKTP